MKIRLVAALLFVFGLLNSHLSARTWTDSTGEYTIEADLVDCQDGVARLKKADGRIVGVPLSKLSTVDREWLRKQAVESPLPPTGKELLLIRAPGVSWLPLKTGHGGFFGTGSTYSTRLIAITYQRNGFRGQSVNVVCAVNIDVKDDADGKLTRLSMFHEETLARSGELNVSWMDPTGQRSLAGQGELEIYLADIKDEEKAISNVIRIPIAADEAARKRLEAKYGSVSDEREANKKPSEKPRDTRPTRTRRRR